MSTFADRAPDRSSADVPGAALRNTGGPNADASDAASPAAVARRAMIDSQLRTSGVNEPWILAAMMRVPREDFVPAAMRDAAYIDRAIPLADGRALAAPLVQGRMLAEAAPRRDDTVLLVGDGAGYLAALLRPMVRSLTATVPGVDPEGGDFSLIVIDGAAEQVPAALVAALAVDGRIVTGLVERGVTRLAVGRRTGTTLALLPLAELGIPLLPEYATPKRWSF